MSDFYITLIDDRYTYIGPKEKEVESFNVGIARDILCTYVASVRHKELAYLHITSKRSSGGREITFVLILKRVGDRSLDTYRRVRMAMLRV